MTVLFTDLVDSTAIRSRIGDDKADALRREHDELLGRVIGEHRGLVVKGLGDGVMAVFHAPSEAVAAACAINQAIVRRNRRARESMLLRMGMSVGEVRVEDDDVFGTPVVEAARLCGKAGTDQILVSSFVRALAGSRSSATYKEVGELDLKGLTEALLAFEVLWWEVAETGTLPFPSIPALSRAVPFVGRHRELLGMADSLSRAGLGKGPLVVIEGAEGAGASRLAAEFALAKHLDGSPVLYGRCDPFASSPFDPFVEALRAHAGFVADDLLNEQLGAEAHHLVRLVPELAGRLRRATETPGGDAQLQATALFEAVSGWLHAASSAEPLIFVLDDLQWASRSTLLMLRHVLQHTDPMRVLVVATLTSAPGGVPDHLTETLAELRDGIRGVDRVSLAALGPDDVRSFVAGAFGGDLPLEVHDAVMARVGDTGVNPLHLLWRLRALSGTSALQHGDHGWSLTSDADAVARAAIPAAIGDAVGGAIDRLPAPAQRVLQVAAVMGDEIDPAVLAALVESDESDVAGWVEDARAQGLLAELSAGRFRHTFTHGSVRRLVYDALDPQTRRFTHGAIADELERQGGPGNTRVLVPVAHHRLAAASQATNDHPFDAALTHETASLDPEALLLASATACAAAGQWARDQLALDESVGWYHQALRCLDATGDSHADHLADVVLALGEVQRLVGSPDARATLLRAADVARSYGDADALARAALASLRDTVLGAGPADPAETEILRAALDRIDTADSPIRARLMGALGVELAAASEHSIATTMADDAVAMARRLHDSDLVAMVLEQAVLSAVEPNQFARRQAWANELGEAAPHLTDLERIFGAAYVRSTVAFEAGDLDSVQHSLGIARDAAARRRHPMLSWHLSIWESADSYARGALDRAHNYAEGAQELGQRARRAEARSSFRPLLLAIRRLQGRLTELVPRLELVFAASHDADAFGVARAMADAGRLDLAGIAYREVAAAGFEAVGGSAPGAAICNLAYLAAILGDTEGAAVLADRLAPLTEHHAVFVVPMHVGAHYLAMLAATRGEVADAHRYFEQAVRHHDRVGMPLLAAESRMEWARFCHAVHAADHARQLAEQTLTLASHHRAHGLDAQARAFLSTLPAASPGNAA